MFKKVLSLTIAMLFACQGVSFAAATQVDSLIEKLVEKGILDKKEARELKIEIAEDAKILTEDTAKAQVPDWVKNTKLKGDVRVRYQYERRKNDTEGRSRGRNRFRLGIESNPVKEWTVGAGIATGDVGGTTDDARSTNVTFKDTFRRGEIRLDYAYGQYQPVDWAKFIVGRYVKNDYLWTTTDMLWDSDINPTGGSAHVERKFSDNLSGFANAGVWVLDENQSGLTTDRADAHMYYTQLGVKEKFNDQFDATLAGVYYGFGGVKGMLLDGVNSTTGSTNSLAGGFLKYDYNSVGAALELGINRPIEQLPIERLAFFGDYIKNVSTNVSRDHTGYAGGVKVGDAKLTGFKSWQVKYQYTHLEADAWPDVFPDSDRYHGATDIKGHELEFGFGLTKNVSLGFDYYQDARLTNAAKNPQKIIQADLNLKF